MTSCWRRAWLGILLGGVGGGSTVYRTLFYMPQLHRRRGRSSCSGRSSTTPARGPINAVLAGRCWTQCTSVVAEPARAGWSPAAGLWALILAALLVLWGLWQLTPAVWRDGDMGTWASCLLGGHAAPAVARWRCWLAGLAVPAWLILGVIAVCCVAPGRCATAATARSFTCRAAEGLGTGLHARLAR